MLFILDSLFLVSEFLVLLPYLRQKRGNNLRFLGCSTLLPGLDNID